MTNLPAATWAQEATSSPAVSTPAPPGHWVPEEREREEERREGEMERGKERWKEGRRGGRKEAWEGGLEGERNQVKGRRTERSILTLLSPSATVHFSLPTSPPVLLWVYSS